MDQGRGKELDASLARLASAVARGHDWSRRWPPAAVPSGAPAVAPGSASHNRLECFFDSRKAGRGIWKWRHYFEIYERHFGRFCNSEVHVLEIGVDSGGSIEMWQDYFGPKARLYGVDLSAQCKAYETSSVKVFTGDQADRNFWREFRRQVPVLDIVIDDGGHQPVQQAVSLEELLPHLRPGGVYLCEDITAAARDGINPFAAYVHGIAHRLNDYSGGAVNPADDERHLTCRPNPFQQVVASVHLYPFVAVVEKNRAAVSEFVAPKHGSQWQPPQR